MRVVRVAIGRRAIFAAVVAAVASMVAAGCSAHRHGPAAAADAGKPVPVTEVRAGVAGSGSEVPWRRVGPGWALVLYSATSVGIGGPARLGPTTLYLVDPLGGRYSLFTWKAGSRAGEWTLQDWSADGRRALFVTSPGDKPAQQVFQLDLPTGHMTGFTLPKSDLAVGYARPADAAVLALRDLQDGAGDQRLIRYSLRGRLQQALWTGFTDGVIQSPGGQLIAIGVANGLDLVASSGRRTRSLPVPGVLASCAPIRWWRPGVILATCTTSELPGADAAALARPGRRFGAASPDTPAP